MSSDLDTSELEAQIKPILKLLAYNIVKAKPENIVKNILYNKK